MPRTSRRTFLEIAGLVGGGVMLRRSLLGEASPIGAGLKVGVLGVINRTMRRRAQRDLVTWDRAARGYRMDPADARVVIEILGRATPL